MIVNLFKPSWKSNSAEKRQKAITLMEVESSENQDILSQLATADEDQSVRLLAIRKLTSIVTLHTISINQAAVAEARQAEKRLNELMSTAGFIEVGQCRDLLTNNPQLALLFVTYIDDSSIRNEAIEKLSEEELLDVLSKTVYSDSRQQIAEKLSDIESLEIARKLLRGKDKNAERILKTKIDNYRQQQRQIAENEATVKKLIEEVEYLAHHDWLPEFKAKVEVHRKQWDMLDFDIASEFQQQYQKSRKLMDDRYEQQILIELTQLSQLQLIQELEAFVHDFAQHSFQEIVESVSEMQIELEQFASRWQQLAEANLPETESSNLYQKIYKALISSIQLSLKTQEIIPHDILPMDSDQTLAEKLQLAKQLSERSKQLKEALKDFQWPVELGELNLLKELQAELSEWHKFQQQTAEERQTRLDSLHKKINSIFHFSRIGNLARAKQYCERVDKALQQFSGKDRLTLQERYEEARKTLGEMGDWKNFATEPKYLKLCESMEKLKASRKHPDKISKEMKDLQQQWKSLGNSEISEQYWPRFKLAADEVYKPCAEFFEERRNTRKKNLDQRQQYVEKMRLLLEDTDWQNDPDYKAVQSAIRSITDHFVAIKDVEHRAGQKQWKQFSKYKDAVFAKLDVVYDANIELKHRLIKQLEVLAENEATEDNLAKLKNLQNRWKQIGITRRNQDQKAWKEFKKQGDIVFNNVQQIRQGKRQETDQQLNAYRDIIKEIQKLAKNATDLAQSDQQFSVLQEKYAALPELPASLPEKLIDGLRRDYDRACDLFAASHSRIINNKHLQQKQALKRKAELCQQMEALGDSHTEQMLEALSQQWDAIELKDATLSRRIEKRWKSALSEIDRDVIAAERRMLCIQLEIIKGVDSPVEDKALRMQYQLDQMNSTGLGQQIVDLKEQLENLELDWLCKPGAQADIQKTLDDRFQRVLNS